MSYTTKDGTSVPLDLPENEKKHFSQPAFIRASRGNERIAKVLDYLIYGAAKEAKDKNYPKGCKVVTIKRTHEQILSTFGNTFSRKSLIRYLDCLNEWGLVLSEPYQRDFTVNFEAIQDALTHPPALKKRTRSKRLQEKGGQNNVKPSTFQPLEKGGQLEKVDTLSKKVEGLSLKVDNLSKKVDTLSTLQPAFEALLTFLQSHFSESTVITYILHSITSKSASAFADRNPLTHSLSSQSLFDDVFVTVDSVEQWADSLLARYNKEPRQKPVVEHNGNGIRPRLRLPQRDPKQLRMDETEQGMIHMLLDPAIKADVFYLRDQKYTVSYYQEEGETFFLIKDPDTGKRDPYNLSGFLQLVAKVRQDSAELSKRGIAHEVQNVLNEVFGEEKRFPGSPPHTPPLHEATSLGGVLPLTTPPLQASNSPVSEEVVKDTASTPTMPISGSPSQYEASVSEEVAESALSTAAQAVSHSQGTLRNDTPTKSTEASQTPLFEEQPAPTPAPTGKGTGKRTSKKQGQTEQKEAPKKPATKATPERVKPVVEISPEGMIIWERWISFFKHKTTLSQMAADYAEKFVEIDPTSEDFKKLRIHLWDSNPGWYGRNGRKKGNITIKDAFNEWAGFVASLECPQEIPNNGGASSNGRRAQSQSAPKVGNGIVRSQDYATSKAEAPPVDDPKASEKQAEIQARLARLAKQTEETAIKLKGIL